MAQNLKSESNCNHEFVVVKATWASSVWYYVTVFSYTIWYYDTLCNSKVEWLQLGIEFLAQISTGLLVISGVTPKLPIVPSWCQHEKHTDTHTASLKGNPSDSWGMLFRRKKYIHTCACLLLLLFTEMFIKRRFWGFDF